MGLVLDLAKLFEFLYVKLVVDEPLPLRLEGLRLLRWKLRQLVPVSQDLGNVLIVNQTGQGFSAPLLLGFIRGYLQGAVEKEVLENSLRPKPRISKIYGRLEGGFSLTKL